MEFLYGKLEDAPEDFYPPEMWPEYAYVSTPPSLCTREEVGTSPRGIRWSLWPLTFEDYLGDTEPDLKLSRQGRLARTRFMAWKRMHHTDAPSGWHQTSTKTWRVDGVIPLSKDIDYTSRWHKNARRDLGLFKKEIEAGRYAIERVEKDEYCDSYKHSMVAQRADNERMMNLERKFSHPVARKHIELWGVRNISSGTIVAGTAIIYSPTYKASTHFAPFILPEARAIYAATGLMDHWFKQSVERGCVFATTTNFWFEGQPKAWRGFSEFKSHFGFSFIAYPPMLWRFVAGKIF